MSSRDWIRRAEHSKKMNVVEGTSAKKLSLRGTRKSRLIKKRCLVNTGKVKSYIKRKRAS